MKTGNSLLAIAFVSSLVAALPAEAQKRGEKGGGSMEIDRSIRRELMDYLYPVHLVRRYASHLKLSDSQVEKLRKIVGEVQGEVEEMKWDVEREAGKLADMVKNGAGKDEVYAQMDKVFAYENKIKKKHIGLLIAVRDILTKEQRSFLDGIKADFERENRNRPGQGRFEPGGHPGGPMGGPPDGPPGGHFGGPMDAPPPL